MTAAAAATGAGSAAHFVECFQGTPVEAALAAGIFHRQEVAISEVKETLGRADISRLLRAQTQTSQKVQ